MEVSVVGLRNVPTNAVVSVKTLGEETTDVLKLFKPYRMAAANEVQVSVHSIVGEVRLPDFSGGPVQRDQALDVQHPANKCKLGKAKLKFAEASEEVKWEPPLPLMSPSKRKLQLAVEQSEYITEHNLEEVMENLIHEVTLEKPEDPLQYMSEKLRKMANRR
mmetsp:Transcript_63075/g.169059  ORF Transcript_63075/g.169059 Transcript_63075/m.169059 type:complete len:162 (+) Transcript_63075:35-520(+)